MGDLVNEFCWSVSQDKEFSECRRRYYYGRYGSWEGWPTGKGDAKTKQLYLLKNLTQKQMWVGSVVHDVVKKVLENFRGGHAVDYAFAEKLLVDEMKNDIESSKQKRYYQNPKRNTGFFEDEYGIGITDEEITASIDFAKLCLRNFFNSEAFTLLSKASKSDWLSVDDDKPGEFSFEGAKIYVKVDAAVKQGNRILVFDWKTSRREDVDYSVQLACYLLFATKQWNCNPSQVDAFEVNLALPRTTQHDGLSAKIDWFEDYMRKSIAAIKSMLRDPQANVAVEEDFPQANDLRRCTHCKYLRVCKPAVLPKGELR